MKSAQPRLSCSHMNCPPCTCGQSQTWVHSLITTWMAQICTLRSHMAVIEESTPWHHYLDFMSKMFKTSDYNSHSECILMYSLYINAKEIHQFSVRIFQLGHHEWARSLLWSFVRHCKVIQERHVKVQCNVVKACFTYQGTSWSFHSTIVPVFVS